MEKKKKEHKCIFSPLKNRPHDANLNLKLFVRNMSSYFTFSKFLFPLCVYNVITLRITCGHFSHEASKTL